MLPRNTSALVLASDGKGGYSAAIVRGPFDRGAPDPLVAALQLLAAEASEGYCPRRHASRTRRA